MAKLLVCRVCGVRDINKDDGNENKEWIRHGNWYAHCSCYEKFKEIKTNSAVSINHNDEAEFWFQALYNYMKYDIKISLDYIVMRKQWEGFLKKAMTAKGMYFAIRYAYEVKNCKPEKANGGIGIVPYVYKEAAQYWKDKEQNNRGIIAAIEQQLQARERQTTIIIERQHPVNPINRFKVALEDDNE